MVRITVMNILIMLIELFQYLQGCIFLLFKLRTPTIEKKKKIITVSSE